MIEEAPVIGVEPDPHAAQESDMTDGFVLNYCSHLRAGIETTMLHLACLPLLEARGVTDQLPTRIDGVKKIAVLLLTADKPLTLGEILDEAKRDDPTVNKQIVKSRLNQLKYKLYDLDFELKHIRASQNDVATHHTCRDLYEPIGKASVSYAWYVVRLGELV